MALVKARWVGPFTAETPNGILNYGDVAEIPAEQAQSGHWEQVEQVVSEQPRRPITTQGGEND